MKFLLTSAGISNGSIREALVGLLGKPIEECVALCIPTAIYPFAGGAFGAYRFISGTAPSPVCELGWKALGVLELTALPSIKEEYWTAAVREADALLVWGGDVLYLRRWMQESGLAKLLLSLETELVYVGVSAGSMVATSVIGETYTRRELSVSADVVLEEMELATPEGEPFEITLAVAAGLGLVDFALIPHVGHERFPENSLASVERWRSRVSAPLYAIDDMTAIQVVDGVVEVVSEGDWTLFGG